MSDPFVRGTQAKPISKETKVGFGVVSVVAISILLWGWGSYSQQHSNIPLHIRNAPVANHVGPEFYLSPLERKSKQLMAELDRSIQSGQNPNPQQPEKVAIAVPLRPMTEQPKMVQRQKPENVINPIVQSLPKGDPIVLDQQKQATPPIRPSRDISGDYVRTADAQNVVKPKNKKNEQQKTNNDFSQETFSKLDGNVQQATFEEELTGGNSESNKNAPKQTGNDFQPLIVKKNDLPKTNEIDEMNAMLSPKVRGANQDNSSDQELENLVVEVIDPPVEKLRPTPDYITNKEPAEFPVNSNRQYVTVRGDSFWTIAQHYYDDGRYFKALYEFNRSQVADFDEIPPETSIDIPQIAALQQKFPALCPGQSKNVEGVYETRDGDTLFDIARRVTGQASNYLEILSLNRRELPVNVNHLTRLPAGISLQLPQR